MRPLPVLCKCTKSMQCALRSERDSDSLKAGFQTLMISLAKELRPSERAASAF